MRKHFLLNKSDQRISIAILVLAIVFLLLVGIKGLFKSAPFGDDFEVFYHAGTLLAGGADPWLALMDSRQPFSYPPHVASLILFYNLFPFPVALSIHTLLNLLSIAAICYCANKWFLRISSFRNMTFAQVLSLALIVGNPYMGTSVYQGQLTLPAAAAVLLSWDFLRQGRWMLAGILLGFSTIKPQLSVLYVLWLVLALNFRVLLIGGGVALLLIVPAAMALGVLTPFQSWLSSLGGYSNIAINAPGSAYVVGIESLFVAYGITGFGPILKPMAFVGLICMYSFRRHIDEALIVHLFFVLAVTFLYGHDYDYAAIIGLWSWLFYLAATSGSWARIVPVLILMFFFFVPQRLVRGIEIPLIVHARTILLLVCCLLVYLWGKATKPAKHKELMVAR